MTTRSIPSKLARYCYQPLHSRNFSLRTHRSLHSFKADNTKQLSNMSGNYTAAAIIGTGALLVAAPGLVTVPVLAAVGFGSHGVIAGTYNSHHLLDIQYILTLT